LVKIIGRIEHGQIIKGKVLNTLPAILAKCYDCMGHYDGGPEDCKIQSCPLYRFMPYRDEK